MTKSLATEILTAVKNLDSKDAAEIKKYFGKKYSQIPLRTYMAYRKVVSGRVLGKESEIVFPVVAMFAFCGQDPQVGISFPRAAKKVVGDNDKEFLRIVEDTPSDNTHMLYRIANLCSRAKQKNVFIDFSQLMVDLCYWEKNEDIKREWIRKFVEEQNIK